MQLQLSFDITGWLSNKRYIHSPDGDDESTVLHFETRVSTFVRWKIVSWNVLWWTNILHKTPPLLSLNMINDAFWYWQYKKNLLRVKRNSFSRDWVINHDSLVKSKTMALDTSLNKKTRKYRITPRATLWTLHLLIFPEAIGFTLILQIL